MPHPRDKVRNAPLPRPEAPRKPPGYVERTDPRHVAFIGTRPSRRAPARVESRLLSDSPQPVTPRFGRAGRGQLPTLAQYVARGYAPEHYAQAMERYRKDLRAEGITPIEPEPHT